MIQQINLYTEELRGRRVRYPAAGLLAALGALAILLLAWYAGLSWQLAGVRAERAELETRVEALTADITRLGNELTARSKDSALKRGILALRTELERKRRLLDALDGADVGDLVGFSIYLEGLGRHRIEGLWLTEIVVADGGTQLALRGSTLAETHVPAYLRALAAEGAFVGREFTTFWMRRPEDGAARLDFALATQCKRRDGESIAASVCEPLKGGG